jgi:fatty acid desaturase
MTLSEPALRFGADLSLGVPRPALTLADKKPAYDASPDAYRWLRRAVIDAGLMERRYGYYLGRTLLSFGFLVVGLALVPLTSESWGWWALLAALLGFAFAQIAMIGHDCGHHQIFKRARPNWALGQVCFSLVVGVGFWSWRGRHNLHHVETNDEDDDPDLTFGGVFTLNDQEAAARHGWRRLIVRYQAWLFVPVMALSLAVSMRAEGWRFAVTELRGSRRSVELSLLTLNAIIWLAPTLALGWSWLGIFALSQVVGGLYLGMTIAPNHKGMPTWAGGTTLTFLERQVLGSRNILPGRIAEFLFGGLNYQIEHHLFPTMPRANLGAAHRIVRPFCLELGLPFEEASVWEAYRQTFAALDRCGRATMRQESGGV